MTPAEKLRVQEPSQSRDGKGVPMAATLLAGVRTPLNRSPHSDPGSPLNERSQALDLLAAILPQKNCKNQEKEVYII